MTPVRMNDTHANRGRFLEKMVEYANQQYRARGRAVIHKVPTAWLPLRDRTGSIRSAKVEEKAAVDFLGVYRSRAIAFDAKQTSETRIRWDRVEGHQCDFLTEWSQHGGLSFILVGFVAEKPARYFLVPWLFWFEGGYNHAMSSTARASLSVSDLARNHPEWEVFPTPYNALDYLKMVDKHYIDKEVA